MVYLLHENQYIRTRLWKLCQCENFYSSSVFFVHAFACAIVITLAGSVVGMIYKELMVRTNRFFHKS
jgi:hypothetical protein